MSNPFASPPARVLSGLLLVLFSFAAVVLGVSAFSATGESDWPLPPTRPSALRRASADAASVERMQAASWPA